MELLWTPQAVSNAVTMVGFSIGLLYLTLVPEKTSDTRLLLLAFGLTVVTNLVGEFYQLTSVERVDTTAAFEAAPWVAFVVQVLRFLGPLALLLMIYRLRFRFAVWEERLILGTVVVAGIWILWLVGKGLPGVIANPADRAMLTNAGPALFVWSAVVAARKTWFAYRKGYDRNTRRMLLMVFLSFIGLAVGIISLTNTVGIWGLGAEWRDTLALIGFMLFVSLLVFSVLLYGEERHTVLAKLVGFLLIAYILLISISTAVLQPVLEQQQDFYGTPDQASLRFTPDSTKGYKLERLSPAWMEPAGALQVSADDAALPMRAPFAVPFFGTSYDSLWVGTNGVISLGAELDADGTYTSGESFFEPIPSIAPLYADLIYAGTGAGTRIDATDSLLVVTWTGVSDFYLYEVQFDFQVLLFADGHIHFNYKRMSTIPLVAYVGISPGGPQPPVDLATASAPAVPGLFTHRDDRLAFRRFVAPQGRRWAWVALPGLFVFLAVGVVFFRIGLVLPLGKVLTGLKQVERGELDAQVHIEERNELGALANHFNSMTQSLQTYSEQMEDLVEERTRALHQTVDDLKQTQAQLVQQEKMASLGQLTAGIAHEIKNPLNFINNFAEVNAELADELEEALRDGEDPADIIDDLRQNATVIAQHGKRADSIVKSMMAHARTGSHERVPTDLNALISEHIDLAYHGKRAQVPDFSVAIERNLDEAVGLVSVVPQDIGRVVLNLLSNAFDVLEGREDAKVTAITRRKDGQVEVIVADNGPGMPEAVRVKVFEPFFTTKPTGQGTGLGLSLSYDIVTQGHGGTMRVESSEDEGAAFIVSLPVE